MQTRATSFLVGLMGVGIAGALAIADPGSTSAISEIPDPAITPGEFASTDTRDICAHLPPGPNGGTYSQRHRLSQTPAVKRAVLEAYGVPWTERAKVEDDHILPLCSGGSDSTRNRWPQYRSGTRWTAGDKDELEAESCRDLCAPAGSANKITQPELRARFLPDWRQGYCRVFSDPRC